MSQDTCTICLLRFVNLRNSKRLSSMTWSRSWSPTCMDFKATVRTIIRLQQQRPYKTCTPRANVNPTNGQLGGHPFKIVALAHHTLVWERYLIVSGGHFCSESWQIYCHKALATLSLNGWKHSRDNYWYLAKFHIR